LLIFGLLQLISVLISPLLYIGDKAHFIIVQQLLRCNMLEFYDPYVQLLRLICVAGGKINAFTVESKLTHKESLWLLKGYSNS